MILKSLLPSLKVKRLSGDAGVEVGGFSMDSRTVKPGDMFVVLSEPGSGLQDRTPFVASAISQGASSVLTETEVPGLTAPQVIVPDTRVASAAIAAAFYGHPTDGLHLIGITGTKGKTSTSYFVSQMLERAGVKTGIIGTTGALMGGDMLEPTNSTPHAINLQRIARQMADMGARAISMEVSSHALKLHRVAGCSFGVAVFTNIGHDHMDFHHSVEDYVQSKARLMTKVISGVVVINADDKWAPYMLDSASCEAITYGFCDSATLRASDAIGVAGGMVFQLSGPMGQFGVRTRLAGLFNVYNALAALGAVVGYGLPLKDAVALISEVGGVPGRVELVDTRGLGFEVVVDYAHTSESLENVLQTLRSMVPLHLITVFGCGGDRDRGKRPVMGAVSARYSDHTIVTSDNPRTEEPSAILQDIRVGLVQAGVDEHRYELMGDRRQAIFRAIALAQPGDIVAICGKGHETGQIIGASKLPFDDRSVVREALIARSGG